MDDKNNHQNALNNYYPSDCNEKGECQNVNGVAGTVAHWIYDDMSYLHESIQSVKAENSQAAIVVTIHDGAEWV